MIEWDMHTDNAEKGLKRVLVMDDMIRQVAAAAPPDTLIVFAADHSFNLRLVGGAKDKPVREQLLVAAPDQKPASPVLRVDGGHTGEEILVAAQGPGAEKLHGFIPNTAIFHLMMDAYGWTETP
jgi:alkaline phosphatase